MTRTIGEIEFQEMQMIAKAHKLTTVQVFLVMKDIEFLMSEKVN